MEILFSILIPAYKSKYLKECINSILAQTYSNYEIIIVDDASPEDLATIVNEFVDSRVHYFRNEKNYGAVNVVDNWNKCLEFASGEYCICMGDDDTLKPWCLEEYNKLIDKYPCLGVYHAQTEIIDENSNYVGVTASRPEYESVYSLMWHRWNGRRQFIGDFLYNTEKLKAKGGFYKLPLAWGSDDISAYIAACPHGIANTQRVCFCYRTNKMTISSSGNATEKMKALMGEIEWYKSFLTTVPDGEQDLHFRQSVLNQFNHHFDKKKALIIADDLRTRSVFRLSFWLNNKRTFGLNKNIILYAFIQAHKQKRINEIYN